MMAQGTWYLVKLTITLCCIHIQAADVYYNKQVCNAEAMRKTEQTGVVYTCVQVSNL